MGMIITLVTILIAILLVLIVLLTSFMLAQRTTLDREKASPFECGFDPLGSARIPFSLRFFLLAVIFLVFDIEIILLIPLPLALAQGQILAPTLGAILFLLILIIGLVHE